MLVGLKEFWNIAFASFKSDWSTYKWKSNVLVMLLYVPGFMVLIILNKYDKSLPPQKIFLEGVVVILLSSCWKVWTFRWNRFFLMYLGDTPRMADQRVFVVRQYSTVREGNWPAKFPIELKRVYGTSSRTGKTVHVSNRRVRNGCQE